MYVCKVWFEELGGERRMVSIPPLSDPNFDNTKTHAPFICASSPDNIFRGSKKANVSFLDKLFFLLFMDLF